MAAEASGPPVVTGAASDSVSRRTVGIVLLGVYASFWLQFRIVRPTNFGGIDEWTILSLVLRGVVDVPYANRPLGLLFNLPVALFPAHLLDASLLLHAHYLVAAGCLTSLCLLRVAPHRPVLALLAGVFAATWAPSDSMRLDSIYSSAYSGTTAATALVFLLLATTGSRPVVRVALAAGLAFVTTRVHEGALQLLLIPPWLLRGLGVRLAWRPWCGYSAATALAALVAGLPLVLSRAPSWYQREVLGVYLEPAGLLERLALQFRLHLEPLLAEPAALLQPGPAASAVVLVLGVSLLGSGHAPADARERRRLLAFAVIGLLGAAAAYSSFILAARLPGALRTEFLAAPWIGLALAAVMGLFADLAPRQARLPVLAALGAFVAAQGTMGTRASQAKWDAIGSYARQAGALAQVVRLAPGFRPGTLVLFVEGAPTWVGSFAFHHGLDVVYGRHVTGWVPNGREQIHYECRRATDGFHFEPWKILRVAWDEPVRPYRFDEVVVFRSDASRRVTLSEQWPAEFAPLPPGSRYHPAARIVGAAPPLSRGGLPGL